MTPPPLRFNSLFSGFGLMDLGLERAGMRCVSQTEIEPFARRVLAKHWLDVPRFTDIRKSVGHDLPTADVLCGGFPCQNISPANSSDDRTGLAGKKSGLWSHFRRLIEETEHEWIIIENVA